MQKTYRYPKFDFVTPPELHAGSAASTGHSPVIVVGAGPVGLCAAIDLAQQGQRVLLLDNDDTVSIGSRGVCYAKRTLEILDRMGCGERFVRKGVSWDVGRTFFRAHEVFHFNLRPQVGHQRPGMINLQQYYLEEYLIERARQLPLLELRFLSEVTEIHPAANDVTLSVQTPEGSYQLRCDWLIAADGAKSPLRHMLGLEMQGQVFKDRFLIADVIMQADYPAERWFWFDPPFHPGQSVLLHKQADQVWRIDFQLGWQADPEHEKKPENVIPRIRAMLGDARPFELEWVSVYTFQCRSMERFNHGRVLFVGDAAHQVSPFGARGANSGIQDSDNVIWKLLLVLQGLAPATLLDSYSIERGAAAEENLMNSTRSTDFITPKSAISRCFRNAVLDLAQHYPFARALVNSGRLSVPSYLCDSPLNTPDSDPFSGDMVPGAPMADAPIATTQTSSTAPDQSTAQWLLQCVGQRFQLMLYCEDAAQFAQEHLAVLRQVQQATLTTEPLIVTQCGVAPWGFNTLHDTQGMVRTRYDLQPGTCYLLRPDQHIAARWRQLDATAIQQAVRRATAQAQ